MEQPVTRRYEDENFVDTSKKVWNYSLLMTRTFKISRTAHITACMKKWVHIP